jgi:hypothetical protein
MSRIIKMIRNMNLILNMMIRVVNRDHNHKDIKYNNKVNKIVNK